MKIKDVMTQEVTTISSDATLQAAAMKMKAENVGFLPVLYQRRLTGVITDRDIAIRAVAEGLNPATATVKEIMSPDPQFAFENQTVREACDLMAERKVRRLMVVDDAEQLVGVRHQPDLSADLLQEPGLVQMHGDGLA